MKPKEEHPNEITISTYWNMGNGRSILRRALPVGHPENSYEWFRREYPDLDPGLYGIYKPMTCHERHKALDDIFYSIKELYGPDNTEEEFMDILKDLMQYAVVKRQKQLPIIASDSASNPASETRRSVESGYGIWKAATREATGWAPTASEALDMCCQDDEFWGTVFMSPVAKDNFTPFWEAYYANNHSKP